MDRDTSVFATAITVTGLGASGYGGGVANLMALEVPIMKPLFTLFSSCSETPSVVAIGGRMYNWSSFVIGDTMLLSHMLSTCLSEAELGSKKPILVKQVDFLELGDVVAQWVQQIVQAFFNDNTNSLTFDQASSVLCPLTLQEVLLLLRNTTMAAFKDTQPGVQGLYPIAPVNSNSNEFVPFVSGASTCWLFTNDPDWPVPLIENIRALSGRAIHLSKSQDMWWMPSIGKFQLDQLASSDYPVTCQLQVDVPNVFPSVFATGVLYKKESRDSKGKISSEMLLESAIDLIDGQTGANQVSINDPTQLKFLATQWNNWLATSGVASYSVKLAKFGTEKGISALYSGSMTRHWNPIVGEKKEKQEQIYPRITDVRLEQTKNKAIVTGPYVDRFVVADSSQGRIMAVPYEQVLQTWVLPQNKIIVNGNFNSTSFQKVQLAMGEPYSTSLSSGNDGVPLAQMHMIYASKMTKAKLAETNDWSSTFSELEKQGRGGILSSIVGTVGEVITSLLNT